jgi:1-deoxy-D-xylulose-5-phosphate reductoisomerase
MKKNAVILGSTGSIGVSALRVIASLDSVSVCGLAAKGNVGVMEQQVHRFKPRLVAMFSEERASELRERLIGSGLKVDVCSGLEGVVKVATMPDADLVIAAIVGSAGLIPLVEAIKSGGGRRIVLANKEALVMAGAFIISLANEMGVEILPIDSEHSAIFQCIKGSSNSEIERLILTASGGPFLSYPEEKLRSVTPEEALAHPTWEMGKKTTVDSATLMNKGFEVIEAHHLFDIQLDRISIVIHPQSVVHSLVEFVDGCVLAQLSVADMRIPIHYALTYPRRVPADLPKLDLTGIGSLTFSSLDLDKFPVLALALEAARLGGTMPAVMSAANEVAVERFLSSKISFLDIHRVIERVMVKHLPSIIPNPEIEDIIRADAWAKKECDLSC